MKLLFSNPATGANAFIETDDDSKVRELYGMNVGQELAGDKIGFPGYLFKITGGSDTDGFPMMLGVKTTGRVKLLLTRGAVGYNHWNGRNGERQRKTVRGGIISHAIHVLNLVVLKAGPEVIPGLDAEVPRRLLPKRASKLRKLYGLTKSEDLRPFCPRRSRTLAAKDGRKRKVAFIRPKIQRLVTPAVVRRRVVKKAVKAARWVEARKNRVEYQHRLDRLMKLCIQRNSSAKRRQGLAAVQAAKVAPKSPTTGGAKGGKVKSPKAAPKVAAKVARK